MTVESGNFVIRNIDKYVTNQIICKSELSDY